MKRIMAVTAALFLSAGVSLVGAGAAQADPSNCSTWTSGAKGEYVHGRCTYGTGEYRVIGKCDRPLASDMGVTGPWVRVDQISSTDCIDLGRHYRAYGLSIQFR